MLRKVGVAQRLWACVLAAAFLSLNIAGADDFNKRADHHVDRLGYYHVLTTDQGIDVPGGNVFRFVTDDPDWDIPIDEWQNKSWFKQNRGLAMTLWQQGEIVWKNHAIEEKQTGTFFQAAVDGAGAKSVFTPGLTSFFSMSNNYDMIYSGYFKLDRPVTFDKISGYFACVAGFAPNHPRIGYRMNIWSVKREGDMLMPAEQSFTGDVFATDNRRGDFEYKDTGVVREWTQLPEKADKVWRLTYTPKEAVTLQPGEYFFSHDAVIHEAAGALYVSPVSALPFLLAGGTSGDPWGFIWFPFGAAGGRGTIPPGKTIVPEPASMGLIGMGVAGLAGVSWLRRRKRK